MEDSEFPNIESFFFKVLHMHIIYYMANLKASPTSILSEDPVSRAKFITHTPKCTAQVTPTNYEKLCLKSKEKCKIVGNGRWVTFGFNRNEGRRRVLEKKALLCCSGEVGFVVKGESGKCEVDQAQSGYLVSGFGWGVRRMVEVGDEMRRVANVQAEAFHVPVALFNDFFFEFFKAEVLSALMYKVRNSPPDRYACLVVESIPNSLRKPVQGLVGVVDVTVQGDEDVIRHLEGVEEYLYVSGIAVLTSFRRQRVATVLLKACEALSLVWGFNYLVLRVYEDDSAAQKLYSNAGYKVVSRDPQWITWIGRKRRVLMIKQTALFPTNLTD